LANHAIPSPPRAEGSWAQRIVPAAIVLFNSYEFIGVFFPIVCLGFFGLAQFTTRTLAVEFLFAASLVFYAIASPDNIGLLLASIAVNFVFGRMIPSSPHAKRWLVAGVGFNLLALGYFKYANFISDNIAFLTGFRPLTRAVELPAGISFFTFTQIAYLADTYQQKPFDYRFSYYGLFVSYFPHLIAGPILHHRNLIPQFLQESTFRPRLRNFVPACTFFTIGLCKKLLADSLSLYVAEIFRMAGDPVVHLSVLDAWTGAIGYGLQLYLDFSGYSDMAVGLSRFFGVTLPFNFLSPYKADCIIEFWRRWNISLSHFLRDYLYIPLGGNRLGRRRRAINLMITMVLGGLWHGASWNFAIWGGIHGFYLLINHAFRFVVGNRFDPPRWRRPLAYAAVPLTFACVTLAWVPFRAESLSSALHLWAAMFGAHAFNKTDVLFQAHLGPLADILALFGYTGNRGANRIFLLMLLVIVFTAPNSVEIADGHWRPNRLASWLGLRPSMRLHPAFAVALGLLFGGCLSLLNSPSEFLYFRF
jgi:D-alanyl-lipoteichoic acid acyltransferase DltB (MBOAT superfamily)